MNIFYLDKDPFFAAMMQCDKHAAGKMIVESAQMLSTAHRVLDGKEIKHPSKTGRMIRYWKHPDKALEEILYKPTHINHPSCVWTRQSNNNYNWLYFHFMALCNEYNHRYSKIHATETKLGKILENPPRNIPTSPFTSPPLAMKNAPECINESDPVGSYRNYYKTKKDNFKMVWTNRPVPEWFE